MKRYVMIGSVLALVAIGCGPGEPRMESRSVVRVDGQVLVNGKGQKGVYLTFFPADSTQQATPQAITDAEGRFKLETYRQPGAPPGEYTVSAVWPGKPDTSKAGDDDAGPTDRLGRRYADPKTSGLRATIKDDPTTLPTFELK